MMRDMSRIIRLSDLELPTNVSTRVTKLAVNKHEQIEISARNVSAIMNLQQPVSKSNLLNRRSSTRHSSAGRSSTIAMDLASMEEVDSLLDHIGERIAEENGVPVVPRLSFQDVHNITSWTYARLILQNFGERYRFRMDLYVGGTIVLFVILAVIVFVHIFLSPHRMKTLLTAFILQTLLSLTAISLLTLSILYTSSLVNEEMDKHNQLLRRHVLLSKHLKQHAQEVLDDLQDLQKHREEDDPNNEDEGGDDGREKRAEEIAEAIERQKAVIESYDMVMEQLETSIDVLESENEHKPFRIFGIPADKSLVMTVLSAILSFYGAIISLFAAANPLLGDVGSAL
jgi:hypothetical protein